MARQTREKQERIIEAVRHGLEGNVAVEFIRQSGYAMTVEGIARHLRTMGGRGRVQELIQQGKSNVEILAMCFPADDLASLKAEPPSQGELFAQDQFPKRPVPFGPPPPLPFETTKITLKIPTDLHTAIRLAAEGEGVTQSQLIVNILTSALSRMPKPAEQESAEEG